MKGRKEGRRRERREEGNEKSRMSPSFSPPWITGKLLKWEVQEVGQVGKRRQGDTFSCYILRVCRNPDKGIQKTAGYTNVELKNEFYTRNRI